MKEIIIQNYPNPFNPSTTLEYKIPSMVNSESSNVSLIVFDLVGKEVATLVNKPHTPGNYKVEFDASMLASGVYIYRLKCGSMIQLKKMLLVR